MAFVKGQPAHPGAGRPKGATNKTTRDARAAFNDLLNNNVDKLQGWLERVGLKDPDKALMIYAALAEFCIPKLSRTEHIGPQGGPILLAAVPPDEASRAYMALMNGDNTYTPPQALLTSDSGTH